MPGDGNGKVGTGSRFGDNGNGNGRGSVSDPAAAWALVGDVVRDHGLDPDKITDEDAWLRFRVGMAIVAVGIYEMGNEHYLSVYSAAVRLPEGPAGDSLAALLLEMNHAGTMEARFSLFDEVVWINVTRPIEGLDRLELEHAIQVVMSLALWVEEELSADWRDRVERLEVPSRQLPQLSLNPGQWERMSDWYRALHRKARSQAKAIMEAWDEAGFPIVVRQQAVELILPGGGRPAVVATLVAEDHGGLAVRASGRAGSGGGASGSVEGRLVDWASKKVETQRAGSTLVISLGAGGTVRQARELGRELVQVAAARGAEPQGIPAPKKTQRQLVLEACDPHVRSIYLALMEGWKAAGGEVRSSGKGRVSLQWVSGLHEAGVLSREPHILSLVTLTPPKGDAPAVMNVAWGLGTSETRGYLDAFPKQVAEFEREVALLPGFSVVGRGGKIAMDEGFGPEEAERLLAAMAKLMRAEQEAFRRGGRGWRV